MLLTERLRRAVRDRDAGSALAAVVGVLAVTGIITATLLTATMFGTGFSSASRAAVQAQAAAEGGLDYAKANLASCNGAPITNPAGTQPVFSVAVAYRTRPTGGWTPACVPLTPTVPPDATQIRLTSTGFAQHAGVAGHDRGNTRVMEAVFAFEFPFIIQADRRFDITGSLTVSDTAARPADMSTNGTLSCGGSLTMKGVVYAPAATSCGTVPVVTSFDPTATPFVLPRLTATDARWPKTPATLTSTGGCAPTGALTLPRSIVQCSGLLKLQNVQLTLTGDVAIFAPQISVDDLSVRSSGGKFSLYLVKPWPAGQSVCPPTDYMPDVLAKKIVTDDFSSVMLYSSTEVQLDSPEGLPVRLQLIGCNVDTKGSPKITLSPTGPLVFYSKRDVTG